MTGHPPAETPPEKADEKAPELPAGLSGDRIAMYNLDDSKTPGGIKIRWKIRAVSGEKARRYDARQAEAIRELLLWSRHHPPRPTS